MRAQSDRLHGDEPGRPPGRVKAPQRPHDDRQSDAQRQKRRRHSQLNAPRDELLATAVPTQASTQPTKPASKPR